MPPVVALERRGKPHDGCQRRASACSARTPQLGFVDRCYTIVELLAVNVFAYL